MTIEEDNNGDQTVRSHGRVAIVTGGNGGIGLGMAKGLAEAGASVVIAGRNERRAGGRCGSGERAGAIEVPTSRTRVRVALVEQSVEAFGRIDILVNNAGIAIRKRPERLRPRNGQVIDTNLTGAFLCSQAVYPHMKKAGGGKIINIGSMLSIFGAPFAARLCGASKGGIVQLDALLRRRLGQGQHPGQRRPAGLDRHGPHRRAAKQIDGLTTACWPARRRSAGATPRISPASRCFSPAPRPTSSPARRFRSMAGIPAWGRGLPG